MIGYDRLALPQILRENSSDSIISHSAFIGTSISLASFKDEFGLSHLSADAFATKSASKSIFYCSALLALINKSSS